MVVSYCTAYYIQMRVFRQARDMCSRRNTSAFHILFPSRFCVDRREARPIFTLGSRIGEVRETSIEKMKYLYVVRTQSRCKVNIELVIVRFLVPNKLFEYTQFARNEVLRWTFDKLDGLQLPDSNLSFYLLTL